MCGHALWGVRAYAWAWACLCSFLAWTMAPALSCEHGYVLAGPSEARQRTSVPLPTQDTVTMPAQDLRGMLATINALQASILRHVGERAVDDLDELEADAALQQSRPFGDVQQDHVYDSDDEDGIFGAGQELGADEADVVAAAMAAAEVTAGAPVVNAEALTMLGQGGTPSDVGVADPTMQRRRTQVVADLLPEDLCFEMDTLIHSRVDPTFANARAAAVGPREVRGRPKGALMSQVGQHVSPTAEEDADQSELCARLTMEAWGRVKWVDRWGPGAEMPSNVVGRAGNVLRGAGRLVALSTGPPKVARLCGARRLVARFLEGYRRAVPTADVGWRQGSGLSLATMKALMLHLADLKVKLSCF